ERIACRRVCDDATGEATRNIAAKVRCKANAAVRLRQSGSPKGQQCQKRTPCCVQQDGGHCAAMSIERHPTSSRSSSPAPHPPFSAAVGTRFTQGERVRQMFGRPLQGNEPEQRAQFVRRESFSAPDTAPPQRETPQRQSAARRQLLSLAA